MDKNLELEKKIIGSQIRNKKFKAENFFEAEKNIKDIKIFQKS